MPVRSMEPLYVDRVFRDGGEVRTRLQRVTELLGAARIPYAVAGDFAVAYWVSRMDPAAARFPTDVDIVVRRADLGRIITALLPIGLSFVEHDGDLLLGPDSEVRAAVRVLFAGELARSDHAHPIPDVDESEPGGEYRVLSLEPLVRLLLTFDLSSDRMHLQDLLDVGLIDASWLSRLPPELAARLQEVFDA